MDVLFAVHVLMLIDSCEWMSCTPLGRRLHWTQGSWSLERQT